MCMNTGGSGVCVLGDQITARLRLRVHTVEGPQATPDLLCLTCLTSPAAAHRSVSAPRLGVAFAYYGVVLASAELLERDLVCGSAAPLVQSPGGDSEESRSPCYCRSFGPLAYRTMTISTVGEIACKLPRPLPCRSLSQPATACGFACI